MLSKSWLYLYLISILAGGFGADEIRRRHCGIRQIELVHSLQVAADGFSAERHRAIDPGADPGRTSALKVAAKAGRNFDGCIDVAALQPLVQIGVIGERPLLDEVSRAAQLFEIGAALVALVMIEYRESQVVDVVRNSESEDQHQERHAEKSEGQANGIADELDRFTDRISQ